MSASSQLERALVSRRIPKISSHMLCLRYSAAYSPSPAEGSGSGGFGVSPEPEKQNPFCRQYRVKASHWVAHSLLLAFVYRVKA